MKCIWCSSRTSRPHPATMSSLGEAIIHLAIDLFHQIRQSEKENIFLSPFSISSALAMTYLGARENTASEMEKVGGSCLFVTGLHGCLLAGVQVTTGLAVPGPTGSSSSPTTHSPAGLPTCSLCLDFPWGLGWPPTIAQQPEVALMEEFSRSEALTKIHVFSVF